MEKELNIAAILKEKPLDTKLWSPISGDCKYKYLIHDSINVWFLSLGIIMLSKKGKYSQYGETIIFPSKQMRDWSKFAWKKGDVLKDRNSTLVFKEWSNDSYTRFIGVYEIISGNIVNQYSEIVNDCETALYEKATQEQANTYLNNVEREIGGKLNLDTLEVEKPKQEFKDGDIVFVKGETKDCNSIGIVMNAGNGLNYHYWANYFYRTDVLRTAESCEDYVVGHSCDEEVRIANKSEKQQLFDALAKEGKHWNPDTLQIEDLPKKCEFKPFDKVLARFEEELEWMPDFFYYYDNTDKEMPYVCIANGRAVQCIPYNDQTKHLLGTTDEWKGDNNG